MVIFPFISQFDPFFWISFLISLLHCLLANRPHVLQLLLGERIFLSYLSSSTVPLLPSRKKKYSYRDGRGKSIPKEVRCVCMYLWTMDRCIDGYACLRQIHKLKHKHVCMCTCMPTQPCSSGVWKDILGAK